MTGHGVLILVSVYLPPKKKMLQSDLKTLLALGDDVILFGDLNSKRAIPIPVLRKLNNAIVFDDWKKAECLADNIELQCSDNPPYAFEHVHKMVEEASIGQSRVGGISMTNRPLQMKASSKPWVSMWQSQVVRRYPVRPGVRIAHNGFLPSFPVARGELTKKKCIRRSCTPAAICEVRTAINKSEHRNAVHNFAHTPQESVLRCDCEGLGSVGFRVGPVRVGRYQRPSRRDGDVDISGLISEGRIDKSHSNDAPRQED
ncbi:hypothetical protein EVAR_75271_1 [Eumeta japonica]|uniref:RNA-directed DNA polymerase from mobile element jockey n=1 Tax=Eumeta variegata TaxID=151549 RepID=A0A4C1V869_EUMVA|nr:hypothetical protein EVAR_75271_1 [Eumeta japonica]